MIADSVSVLVHEINAVQGHYEHAVFGSTALALRGVIDREPDDIDVMVTRRVWGALLAREGWHVETPRAGDPPILSLDVTNPLHLFFAWKDEAVQIDPLFVILSADRHRSGLRLCTVREVLRHKRAAYAMLHKHPRVAKHAPDIEACERWLGRA